MVPLPSWHLRLNPGLEQRSPSGDVTEQVVGAARAIEHFVLKLLATKFLQVSVDLLSFTTEIIVDGLPLRRHFPDFALENARLARPT
eukprot:CAMPEP_0115706632 /NCGR_PEP_ID=MMETSP0272-20121206/70905_1 /TAXON_ID=71861 /ORGANISM="Scrippsiella trochoidea, Strain CCMP3099" /LENGTH=86 /DNA_ID=CAMNT_0003147915 /DNA_START=47 /DNA_END=304 /DNA_ORIENTATION=-